MLKPLVRAVLYALAEQRHGPQVRKWGMWLSPRGELVITRRPPT